MALTTGILFGLIAMFAWGTSNFLSANSVRKTNISRAFLWSQIVGLIFYLIMALIFFDFSGISFLNVGLILTTGLLIVIGGSAFFKGLQIGYLSIISPIASASAVITVILSLIFLKEVLSFSQAAGISLAILGAILTSFKFHDLIRLNFKKYAVGAEYALIAMFAFGIQIVLIDVLVSDLGWFLPIILIRATVVFYMLSYLTLTKKDRSFPKNAAKFIIPGGIMQSVALLSISIAVSTDLTAVVAPISSAFPIIAIILARIFFKEILELNQKIGIVVVISGILLLTI